MKSLIHEARSCAVPSGASAEGPMQDYIHGTSDAERQRLDLLNRITNESFIDYLGDLSDKKICDFGCGVGTLAAAIAERFPGETLERHKKG